LDALEVVACASVSTRAKLDDEEISKIDFEGGAYTYVEDCACSDRIPTKHVKETMIKVARTNHTLLPLNVAEKNFDLALDLPSSSSSI
jgi:hypothetical protein